MPIFYIILSCIVIWRSAHGFEIASDFLGRKLPLGIKGASLNAIASSMPEFLTTMFFLFYLRDADGFSGGLGVTSGSALFNLLVIPALVVLILFSTGKQKSVELNKKVLLREGSVLLLSQIIFINFLFKGELKGIHGLVLLLVYLAYMGLLFVISKKRKFSDPGFRVPEEGKNRHLMNKMLRLDLTSIVLTNRKISTGRAWLLLAVSTMVMTFGTWLLVYGTDLFGEKTHIPLIFVAVVLSAAATSVPDTIISIKDARKGNLDDAVSNALGSNIFDIAFALGFPLLLYNLIYGEHIVLRQELLSFTKEVWVFLLLATFLALAIMMIGKRFSKKGAILMLAIYFLFLVFVATQVGDAFSSIGQPIGEFLKDLADKIGEMLN